MKTAAIIMSIVAGLAFCPGDDGEPKKSVVGSFCPGDDGEPKKICPGDDGEPKKNACPDEDTKKFLA